MASGGNASASLGQVCVVWFLQANQATAFVPAPAPAPTPLPSTAPAMELEEAPWRDNGKDDVSHVFGGRKSQLTKDRGRDLYFGGWKP